MIGTRPIADRHDTRSAAPRWLKLLVAAMGVLIVCGTVGIIVAALQYPKRAEFPEHSVVNLPPGAEIREVRLEDGRIVVHTVLENDQSRLILIDAETGKQLGVVDFRTETTARD